MDDIRELRDQLSMTQKDFSDHFGIPKSSLQKWEQGTRKPPEYVVSMIKRLMIYEKLISEAEARKR